MKPLVYILRLAVRVVVNLLYFMAWGVVFGVIGDDDIFACVTFWRMLVKS